MLGGENDCRKMSVDTIAHGHTDTQWRCATKVLSRLTRASILRSEALEYARLVMT